jgi:hypothetical protein
VHHDDDTRQGDFFLAIGWVLSEEEEEPRGAEIKTRMPKVLNTPSSVLSRLSLFNSQIVSLFLARSEKQAQTEF